jgi:hypothetical protein
MGSDALTHLQEAVEEVDRLQEADPTPTGAIPLRPDVTRAINRASIVLLSSHLERYIHNVNEQAIEQINLAQLPGGRLPQPLRLLHSHRAVLELAETAWEGQARASKLADFARSEVWLWTDSGQGVLDHRRLLTWMTAPKPDQIVRYYRYWLIDDIFTMITRKPHTRSYFWLKISELVDKRNNIAHGDIATDATRQDVRQYAATVREFCRRADSALSRQISRLLDIDNPW